MRVALALAACLCGLASLACDGGNDSPAPTGSTNPTATATGAAATATPADLGDFEAFMTFAQEVEAALANGDGGALARRGHLEEVVCVGDEEVGPCAGRPAGALLSGIRGAIAQSDAFSLFVPDDYAIVLSDWFAAARPDLSDEYGGGDVTLYALAHRPSGESGDEAFQAIVTGIFAAEGAESLRQARVLSFLFLANRWRITEERFATVPETAADWLSGQCGECYDRWERWGDAP